MSHKTAVVAYVFHVFIILDRLCKLSASMSRTACPYIDTMSAPASMRNVCTFMFFPFNQRRRHHLLSHSHSSALLRLLLLVIHLLLIHHIINRGQSFNECDSHVELQSESHDSPNEVLQRPLDPRVPRNRRILTHLLWKKLIWPSYTFFGWVCIYP